MIIKAIIKATGQEVTVKSYRPHFSIPNVTIYQLVDDQGELIWKTLSDQYWNESELTLPSLAFSSGIEQLTEDYDRRAKTANTIVSGLKKHASDDVANIARVSTKASLYREFAYALRKLQRNTNED